MSLDKFSGKVHFEDGMQTVTGSTQQFPDHVARVVRFKVAVGNTVFIGDATPSYPVAAGHDTGWFECNNLNEFYHSTGAGGSSGTVYYLLMWD